MADDSISELNPQMEWLNTKRIRLEDVHYELTQRYEVTTGESSFLMPDGLSCEESITAYYEIGIHGYHLMIVRTPDGKMTFTSDFPRGGAGPYSSLKEAEGTESYRGFVALARRMNKYRREALTAFANPLQAKRKRDVSELFGEIERAFTEIKDSRETNDRQKSGESVVKGGRH